MATVRGAALGLLLLAGCGDPLVGGDYGGPSKLLLRGRFLDAQPALQLPTDVVRAGLFWQPRGQQDFASFTALIEQPSNSRDIKYPGGFNWTLFDEPLPEHFVTTASGARYAFGVPLAYLDGNGNRRWDPDEPIIADSPVSAVLFAPAPLAAADSPTGRDVAAGYYVILATRFCSPQPAAPVPDGDCGVPLGAACNVDADCGGGVCLANVPWAGGYCAIPEPPPNGCRQKGAALFRDAFQPTQAWWVKACQAPSDCDRGFPYQCEVTWGACLPSAHVLMVGSRQVAPRSFCAENLPPGSGPPSP